MAPYKNHIDVKSTTIAVCCMYQIYLAIISCQLRGENLEFRIRESNSICEVSFPSACRGLNAHYVREILEPELPILTIGADLRMAVASCEAHTIP